MYTDLTEAQLELRLERAAHRETKAQLARALEAGRYWQTKAQDGEQPLPNPLPIQAPVPMRGGVGDGVVVRVCALIEAAAKLAGHIALAQGGAPISPELGELVLEVRAQLARLEHALTRPQGEGGTPHTGDTAGVPPHPTR